MQKETTTATTIPTTTTNPTTTTKKTKIGEILILQLMKFDSVTTKNYFCNILIIFTRTINSTSFKRIIY